MSTIYMSQLSTALPLMEVPGDHHHHHQGHFQAAFSMQHPKDPSLGLFPFVITSSSSSDVNGGLAYGGSAHQPQHMMGGSSSSVFAASFPTVDSIRDDMIERSSSSFDPYDINNLHAAAAGGGESAAATAAAGGNKYWSSMPAGSAPAKMRITRKASDPAPAKKPRRRAQAYEDNYSYSGMNQALGVIRVCSDCNTTKTPLWRSGPCGPKSLCNACGIRQRKARRAMTMQASAAGDGGVVDAAAAAAVHVQPLKVKKEKIRSAVDVDRSLPFKKRSKQLVQQNHTAAPVTTTTAGAAPAIDLTEIIGAKWTKKSTPTSPPPSAAAHVSSSIAAAAAASCFQLPSSTPAAVQDEITDAALLLMTLSCELVRS